MPAAGKNLRERGVITVNLPIDDGHPEFEEDVVEPTNEPLTADDEPNKPLTADDEPNEPLTADDEPDEAESLIEEVSIDGMCGVY
jgi:mycofactocin precursor